MDLRERLQITLGDAYALERELGGGGMSRVFLAEERALGRKVVVKVLPPETAGQVSVERFKREIALAAQLQHPHIVPLLTAGDAGGLPFFTMPYVSGESLRARLAKHGELPVAEAARVLREIASALAFAHARGVVHRDVKPDNVLIAGGSAMVTDFGVAKALNASTGTGSSLTSMGVALGTPAYMSPEQASADPQVDHRADIYSWGVLAYELLTGQPPFASRPPQAMLVAHVSEAPELVTKRRASIPAPLAQLVMRCLEKRPADRPQSAEELVHALDALATPSGGMEPTSALPATLVSGAMATPRSRQILAGVAVVVVLAVISAVWIGGRSTRSTTAATAATSLAVLPFESAGDTANAYFADGMSEEVNTALTKLPGVRVLAHSVTTAFRGKPPAEVGQKLGVSTVLAGSVRALGGQVRVTVSLVSVGDGSQVWAKAYTGDMKNVFALQDSISQAIAAALRITLSEEAQSQVTAHGTQNIQAHDLVQRGRFLTDQYNETSLRAAVPLFEQAIQLDSGYAGAWDGLSQALARLADDWEAPHEQRTLRKHAAERAVALDPGSAEAHGALAVELHFYDRRYADADREYVRALTIDSASVSAGIWYPFLLMSTGHRDSALAVGRRALRLNPYSVSLLTHMFAEVSAGMPLDSALQFCSRAATLTVGDPGTGPWCLARTYFYAGRPREALAAVRAAPPPASANDHAYVAAVLAETGDAPAARAELKQALDAAREQYVREGMIAATYVALGDRDRAIEWLKRLLASDGATAPNLNWYAPFAPFRSDPRFAEILTRAGLKPLPR